MEAIIAGSLQPWGSWHSCMDLLSWEQKECRLLASACGATFLAALSSLRPSSKACKLEGDIAEHSKGSGAGEGQGRPVTRSRKISQPSSCPLVLRKAGSANATL
jgi:hypothetical protein